MKLRVGRVIAILGFLGYALLFHATSASAVATCDLTTPTSPPCTINGAIFQIDEVHPSGTGVIDSFVRIQQTGSEQGYNTSFRPVQFDEKTDLTYTHDLRTSAVPVKNIGGVNFREFFLDINEPDARDKKFLTLDQLEVFLTDSSKRNGYAGTPNTPDGSLPGTVKVYDLDESQDDFVQLNYEVSGQGSGSSDMVFYVPDSPLWTTNAFVNLFSQFGRIDGNEQKFLQQGGFEEWFVKVPVSAQSVPQPATVILLLSSGLVIAACRLRRAPQGAVAT